MPGGGAGGHGGGAGGLRLVQSKTDPLRAIAVWDQEGLCSKADSRDCTPSMCARAPANSTNVADLYNVGTLVYVVGASDRIRSILAGAGVFEYSVALGGWPLVEADCGSGRGVCHIGLSHKFVY